MIILKYQKKLKQKLEKYPINYQLPGETNAWRYLNSFMTERGKNYQKIYLNQPKAGQAVVEYLLLSVGVT